MGLATLIRCEPQANRPSQQPGLPKILAQMSELYRKSRRKSETQKHQVNSLLVSNTYGFCVGVLLYSDGIYTVGRTAGGVRSLERQMVNSQAPEIFTHVFTRALSALR